MVEYEDMFTMTAKPRSSTFYLTLTRELLEYLGFDIKELAEALENDEKELKVGVKADKGSKGNYLGIWKRK